MLDKNKLRGAIATAGLTQKELASRIGISETTFSRKMRVGVFGIDEVQIMIDLLSIANPSEIFFAKEITSQVNF